MPELTFQSFPLTQPTRNQKPCCESCQQPFGITTREHLCKRCFLSVCDSCSPHKQKVYRADMLQRAHRLCNNCYQQSQIIRKYAQSNRLVWGEDSDMCQLWMRQLGLRHSRNSYNGTKGTKNRKAYTAQVAELWKSLNYSFREFIGVVVDRNKGLVEQAAQNSKKSKSKNSLSEIYSSIMAQALQNLSAVMSSFNNPAIEPQNIMYFLLFFMAHACSNNAVTLTKSLIQVMSFETASLENITYYLEILKCSEIETYKLQAYLEGEMEKIVARATLNYFSIEITIDLICALLGRKNFEELYKVIAYTLSKRKQFICKNSNKPQLIMIDLLRNHGGLGDGYKKFSKLCDEHDFQAQISSMADKEAEGKSTPTKNTNISDEYQKLLRQNQQLRIKNKNQQEQIVRLKAENNHLVFKEQKLKEQLESKDNWAKVRKKSALRDGKGSHLKSPFEAAQSESGSMQSYWSEEKESHQMDQQKESLGQRAKLIKKYRKRQNKCERRKTTMSQTMVNQIQQFNKKHHTNAGSQGETDYKCEEVIYEKNQQISQLRKQIQFLKLDVRGTEEQTSSSKLIQGLQTQNQDLKKQLQGMQEMNRQLLVKMKQLSNMLMDKEEEQVNEEHQTLESLVGQYEESQLKDPECRIF